MQYLLIGLFSYWFACLSKIPNTVTLWLILNNIYYKEIENKKVSRRFLTYRNPALTNFEGRLIPFDCEKCLAFWIALSYSVYDGERWIEVILYSGLASLTAIVSGIIINKIRP